VTAVIWANLGGQKLGAALVYILYGANPSGRLVYTIARNDSDYAQPRNITTPQPYPQLDYTESISFDYRDFGKKTKKNQGTGSGMACRAQTLPTVILW
jgi:beta-glucosidase